MHIWRTIGRRTVPVGTVLVVTAAAVVSTAVPAFASVVGNLSTHTGPSGGGNTITITAASGTPFGTQVVEFQPTATCAAHFVGTAGNIEATPVTVGGAGASATFVVPAGVALGAGQTSANYSICSYSDNTGSGNPITTSEGTSGGDTIYPTVSLSATHGPAGGGNNLVLTSTVPVFSVGGTIGVEFQVTDAPTNYTTWCTAQWAAASTPITGTTGVVPATTVAVLSTTKVAVTVPATVIATTPAGGLHVCVYDNNATNANLLAGTAGGTTAPYSVAAVASIATVSPAGSPAQGGGTLTVTGTNLGNITSATLAGQPLTLLTNTATSFTATIPAHSAGGPYNLVVSTLGGTVTAAGVFTYTNGIIVTPNTAPNTRAGRTWIDVAGVGFNDLVLTSGSTNTTGNLPNGPGAHVYLVKGPYDPKATTGGTKTTGQVAECVDVLVVSDQELVCALLLNGTGTPSTTTRSITGCTVAANSAALVGSTTSTTMPCTFSSADVGMYVTGSSSITAGTTISAVTDATHATLSQVISATAILSTATLVLNPSRSVTGVSSGGAGHLNELSPGFTAGDVGHAVQGAGIPAGTTITAVASGTATLSTTPTTALATAPVTVFDVIPIPNNAYTITVVNNGSVGANTAAGYSQSIISSGSTFTVADY
jgi:hypothetical protein